MKKLIVCKNRMYYHYGGTLDKDRGIKYEGVLPLGKYNIDAYKAFITKMYKEIK